MIPERHRSTVSVRGCGACISRAEDHLGAQRTAGNKRGVPPDDPELDGASDL
jgi:hypothetical protein